MSRRSMLATAGIGALTATAGCVRRLRSVVNRDGLEQLSVTIASMPADDDREGIQLARRLRDVLQAAGADADVSMQPPSEFYLSVLVNHDFDMYVGRHPGATDPDFLYEALYSTFADESGWQNPYGYTNLAVDDLLDSQRRADGDERVTAIEALLSAVVEERPFIPVCAPREVRVVRTDRFAGWGDGHPATRLGYLGLEPSAGVEALRGISTDARASQNLNPLSVEYRRRGTIVSLLYDSLATDGGDELAPWLAADWEWTAGDEGGSLEVSIREGHAFHDGEPVTAEDVAFTYEFWNDTSLGRNAVPAPAPRNRGLVSAVERVEVDDGDDHSLTMTVDAGEAVAERALTVPILPRHVWKDRAETVSVRGYDVPAGVTEALVAENVPPVGSGPFVFEDRAVRNSLTFSRNDDHFSLRPDVDLPAPTVETFRLSISPRSTNAISVVEDDGADVTTTTLETYAIDGVTESAAVSLLESPTWTFYEIGFNTRKAPFSNPNFRRVVAQLLDREWLTETVFDGYATPTVVPVTEEWTPDSLTWGGADPTGPTLATDGELDVDAATEAFVDAGFRYDEDGSLLVRH